MPSVSEKRNNIRQFYEEVEMPGGYSFNHPDTLRDIDLYYNSKFKTGQFDNRGFRKFFYNIVKDKCDIATKFIDMDTKDIILYSDRDDDLRVWLLSADLKQWMKLEKFPQILNQVATDLPKYGSVVLKKVKGKLSKVNLENLRVDTTSDSLENSGWVYEIHKMNKQQVKSMPWDEDAKEELFSNDSEYLYTIYECYDLQTEGKKWKRTIYGDLFSLKNEGNQKSTESLINDERDYRPAILLHEDEVDELPYRELHWEKVPGRWLGRGYVELLFDAQIAENEAENLERKGLYYTSLHLFTTRDDTVGRNVLTDVENGDIIKTTDELKPVANEERNLPAYNATRSRWADVANKLTFAFDIARGENLPSRTPLGVANLSAGMVSSFFDQKREEFGLFIKDLLLHDIIPEFKNKSKKEHILTLTSSASDFDKILRLIVKMKTDEAAEEYATRTGFVPSQIQRQREEEKALASMRSNRNVRIKIPDSFYTNAKFHVDIITTGEQVDTGARFQLLNTTMQIVSANPAILQNKGTRTMLFKTLQLGGISPMDLNLIEEQLQAEPPQVLPQGGSVAAAPQQPPTQLPTTQQL